MCIYYNNWRGWGPRERRKRERPRGARARHAFSRKLDFLFRKERRNLHTIRIFHLKSGDFAFVDYFSVAEKSQFSRKNPLFFFARILTPNTMLRCVFRVTPSHEFWRLLQWCYAFLGRDTFARILTSFTILLCVFRVGHLRTNFGVLHNSNVRVWFRADKKSYSPEGQGSEYHYILRFKRKRMGRNF